MNQSEKKHQVNEDDEPPIIDAGQVYSYKSSMTGNNQPKVESKILSKIISSPKEIKGKTLIKNTPEIQRDST